MFNQHISYARWWRSTRHHRLVSCIDSHSSNYHDGGGDRLADRRGGDLLADRRGEGVGTFVGFGGSGFKITLSVYGRESAARCSSSVRASVDSDRNPCRRVVIAVDNSSVSME